MTAPTLWIQAAGRTAVGFGLAGDSQTTRSGGSGGGGWQIIDRPRRKATTEWVDYGVLQVTASLILDGYGPGGPQPVDAAVAEVESWEFPVPGSTPPLPPILTVTGPVPHNELSYVLQQLVWKEAIRDQTSRARYQQNLDIVLWEYAPPTITAQAASPAAAAAATPAAAARATPPAGATNSAGARSYTVKLFDTLQTIAAALYGSYTYWTLLANANNIRDPNSVPAGRTLTVPAKTSTPPALNLPSTPAFLTGS